MIAYVPGRRRNARSLHWRWLLVLFGLALIATAVASAACVALSIRTAGEPAPTADSLPTATATPYIPAGPDVRLPAAYPAPVEVSQGPRTTTALALHLGPDQAYVRLGTLQAGAPIDVVGRDESGDWLAVVFPPNSHLLGWLRVSEVAGVTDVHQLPVEPVQSLP